MSSRKTASSSWERDANVFFEKYDKQKVNNFEKYELRSLLGMQSQENNQKHLKLPYEYNSIYGSQNSSRDSANIDLNLEKVIQNFKELQGDLVGHRQVRKKSNLKRNYSDDYECKEEEEEKHFPSQKASGALSISGVKRDTDKTKDLLGKKRVRRVHFAKNIMVKYMPAKESTAAQMSRKGPWEAAPEDDELWDGDTQSFREIPLTKSQLEDVIERKKLLYAEEMYYDYDWSHSQHEELQLEGLDSYFDKLGSNELDSACANFNGKPSSRFSYMSVSIENWSTSNLCEWLRSDVDGGEYYIDKFDKEQVNGKRLLQADEKYLRNIGIRRHVDRLAILGARDRYLSLHYSL